MAQGGGDGAKELDIDALMNSQGEPRDTALLLPPSTQPSSPTLMQENSIGERLGALAPLPLPSVSQNGNQGAGHDVIDLTRPVRTEGEPSPSGSTASHSNSAPLQVPLSRPAALPAATGMVAAASPDGLAGSMAMASMSAFGGNLGGMAQLGNQLQLTMEEQQETYKRANLLALSALAKKGGPSAREMLSVQAKLQEFLTNLISLAGKQGSHLKLTVQALVQKLVTGSITEEEFAKKIETDLQSQHQPSLLPFLRSSVPHLRNRLQLQQAIMKELLQKQAKDRRQRTQPPLTPVTLSMAPPLSNAASPPVKPVQLQQAGSVPPTSNSVKFEVMGSKGAPGPTPHPPLSAAAQQQLLQAVLRVPSPQQVAQFELLSKATPIQRQALLTKMSLEQRALYIQYVRTQHQQAQQKNSTTTFGTLAAGGNTALPGARPPAPSLAQVKKEVASSPSSIAASITTSQQTVLERQQQLVKEQQVPIIVGAKGMLGPAQRAGLLSQTDTTGPLMLAHGTSPAGSPKSVAMASSSGKRSFSDMHLSSVSPGAKSVSPGQTTRGKSRKGKDASGDVDEEEDDEGMDIAGVNLKEETAHFLPQSLGEGVRKICTDEVFLHQSLLRKKVLSTARRYGITDVSPDYLTLLSHATQERLRNIVEKLTVISQHRVEVLKDESHYELTSEVRGQLKVLEKIDRINHNRKQEREKEKIMRAAKSRSKVDDPEMAAKIKEQAKQLQLEEEQKIRNLAANATALAAIGSRRKRSAAVAGLGQDGAAVASGAGGSGDAGSNGSGSGQGANFSSQPRLHKRRITSRDVVFYMEQERETRKSTLLYRSYLK